MSFASADVDIVEGLAQFYTDSVCSVLAPRMPDARAAYEKLLEHQSGPYRAHLAWGAREPEVREVVRASMIECRSRGITTTSEFENMVKRYYDQISSGKGRVLHD